MRVKPFVSRQGVTLFLQGAEKACTLQGLRHALTAVDHRIGEAQRMGWPALAQSWQQDADRIKQMIHEKEHGKALMKASWQSAAR